MRKPILMALGCWIAALPAVQAAPITFLSQDGEIALHIVPYRGSMCASAQCRTMLYALLGTQRPVDAVASLSVTRKGKTVRLPVEGMVDPQLANAGEAAQRIRLSCDTVDQCTVRGVFGDGGAVYVGEWIVRNGMAVRTVFSPSQDLSGFVRENLAAPVYE